MDAWTRAVGPELERLEGRNPVREALKAGKRIRALWVDEASKQDPKLDAILRLADKRGLEVQRVARRMLDDFSRGGVHNGVIAAARPLPDRSVADILGRCAERGKDPVLVLIDEVHYEHNVGAVMRTADAAGVSALVVPVRRGARMSPVVARVAMGAAEHVPFVREGLSSALATIRRSGIKVVGFEAGNKRSLYDVDLTGPIAMVFGGEDKGLSPTLVKRCDAVVSLPMQGRISTLNVSVAVGVCLYERLRQVSAESTAKDSLAR